MDQKKIQYRRDELRFRKHRVTLANQNIVEMAYLTKDMIDSILGKKLTMDEAHCYVGCFNACRKLLKVIDKTYLKPRHKELAEFYKDGRGINWERDILTWEVNPNA